MSVNKLPSKTKEKLCHYYSRRFLLVPFILAAARSASFSSSSLWFYCFAANRSSQPEGCKNTFVVTLAANKNKKQNKVL